MVTQQQQHQPASATISLRFRSFHSAYARTLASTFTNYILPATKTRLDEEKNALKWRIIMIQSSWEKRTSEECVGVFTIQRLLHAQSAMNMCGTMLSQTQITIIMILCWFNFLEINVVQMFLAALMVLGSQLSLSFSLSVPRSPSRFETNNESERRENTLLVGQRTMETRREQCIESLESPRGKLKWKWERKKANHRSLSRRSSWFVRLRDTIHPSRRLAEMHIFSGIVKRACERNLYSCNASTRLSGPESGLALVFSTLRRF